MALEKKYTDGMDEAVAAYKRREYEKLITPSPWLDISVEEDGILLQVMNESILEGVKAYVGILAGVRIVIANKQELIPGRPYWAITFIPKES